jgi:hypothetical protein
MQQVGFCPTVEIIDPQGTRVHTCMVASGEPESLAATVHSLVLRIMVPPPGQEVYYVLLEHPHMELSMGDAILEARGQPWRPPGTVAVRAQFRSQAVPAAGPGEHWVAP